MKHHVNTQEVTGSSPVPPIPSLVLFDTFPIRELLETLLGPEERRRLQLRRMTNPDLFPLYDRELVLKIRNTRNLGNERRLLDKFEGYLGQYPPSSELAKGFLAHYAHRKPRTLVRYAATIKSFMKWYGEPMEDLRISVPRSLPPYTEGSDVAKLRSAIDDKKTHKGTIVRDSLLVGLALSTEMRRSELAVLEAKGIHSDFLIAHGKGNKEWVIPLLSAIAIRLHNFIRGMKPGENVFKLKAVDEILANIESKRKKLWYLSHLMVPTNMGFKGNCQTTAMGIMPHTDIDKALELSLSLDMPYWPQLPNVSYYEDMYAQASQNFPGFVIDANNKKISFDSTRFQKRA